MVQLIIITDYFTLYLFNCKFLHYVVVECSGIFQSVKEVYAIINFVFIFI